MKSIYLLGCLLVITMFSCQQQTGPSAAIDITPDSARTIAKIGRAHV